jgi:hypothetical protein
VVTGLLQRGPHHLPVEQLEVSVHTVAGMYNTLENAYRSNKRLAIVRGVKDLAVECLQARFLAMAPARPQKRGRVTLSVVASNAILTCV